VSETNINLAELVIKCLGMLSNEYLNRCNAVLNRVCCALRMKRSYLFLDQFLFRLVVILFFALYFAAFICQHRFSFTAT